MAVIVYGRKVREDAAEVAYSYGSAPDAPEGVLVIPVGDVDAWHVEGQEGEPFGARRVFQKALRGHRATGAWPQDASHYA